MNKDPKLLHPALQELWAALVPAAKAKGVDIALTCTYRSNEEQARLYAQGRDAQGRRIGNIVTNAKPGQSAHNVAPPEGSHAFDFVVLDARGGYDWQSIPKYLTVATLAREMGAECGAFWTAFKDYPHVQMPGWEIGKRYGPDFRFVKSKPVTPAPAPVSVPAAPALGRIVFMLDQGGKTWQKMTTSSIPYGGHLVTRLPGGVVQITPIQGRPHFLLAFSLDDKGQLWIARKESV